MSMLSGVGMTVCMIGLAVYLQLVPNGSQIAIDNRHLSCIPLVLLLVYVVCTSYTTRLSLITAHASVVFPLLQIQAWGYV